MIQYNRPASCLGKTWDQESAMNCYSGWESLSLFFLYCWFPSHLAAFNEVHWQTITHMRDCSMKDWYYQFSVNDNMDETNCDVLNMQCVIAFLFCIVGGIICNPLIKCRNTFRIQILEKQLLILILWKGAVKKHLK